MIKILRVKCTQNGAFSNRFYTKDFCHTGSFTKNKEYIAIFSTGIKSIKIYDDNINAITFCKPDRCGFGKDRPDYVNFFEDIESFEYLANKKELREEVLLNHKRNLDAYYREEAMNIRRIK